MAEEVDIFMAKIVRQAANQPWGFRVEGGHNSGGPLIISAVVPGSPAGSIGLQPGDVITKIFDRQTKFLTHQQAADIIGAVKNDTLTLTVERSAGGIQQPQQQHHYPQLQHDYNYPQQQQQHFQREDFHSHFRQDHHHRFSPKPIVPYDSTPTYKGSVQINLASPTQSPPPQQRLTYQPQRVQTIGHGDDDQGDVDDHAIPQSRTFKRLQNFMENNQPLGAAGLPPPRSASMEQMKQQQQKSQGQGRVKVIMSQKYNNPLMLYSADNVIDTFSTQVGSILQDYQQ